jgi:predicted small lipoprotein YifL
MLIAKQILVRAIALVASMSALAGMCGCGQTGQLYLPAKHSPAAQMQNPASPVPVSKAAPLTPAFQILHDLQSMEQSTAIDRQIT